MLSHPLRRAIAACASVLLVVGLLGLTSSASQADETGGTITGRLTDPRGLPIKGASVEVYDAGGEPGSPAPAPSTVVITNSDGVYTTYALAGPTKLRFTKTGYAAAEWFDDTASFDTATSLTVPVDGSTTADAVLADAQLRSTRAPRILGTAKYGGTVSAGAGLWAPGYPVTRSYRWARKSGTKMSWIVNASSSRYTVRSGDIGKRLVLRETVRPVGTYPGVAAATRYSNASTIVKRLSKVSVTATRSSGRIKVTARITVKGVAHPKGSIQLRAQNYVGSRRYGSEKRKTVTFRDGKATWSFSGRAGGWGLEARYAGSSTVAAAYDTGYAFFGYR